MNSAVYRGRKALNQSIKSLFLLFLTKFGNTLEGHCAILIMIETPIIAMFLNYGCVVI